MTPLIIPKNLGRKVVPLLRKTPDTCDIKVNILPMNRERLSGKMWTYVRILLIVTGYLKTAELLAEKGGTSAFMVNQ